MTITAALVVFATTWFMVFFMVLPFRYQSQGEAGHVVPGTPSSAPADAMIKGKAKITTVIAVVISGLIYWVVTSGLITIDNMDVFGIMK